MQETEISRDVTTMERGNESSEREQSPESASARQSDSADSPTVSGTETDGATTSAPTAATVESDMIAPMVMHTTIVYRTANMFQTTIAAIMSANVRAIGYVESGATQSQSPSEGCEDFASINLTEQERQLCENILQDKPHKIILVDDKWSDDFLRYIIAQDSDHTPIVTILSDADKSEGNIIRMAPRTFRATMPCDGVISAEMIADYMFVSEFAQIYRDERIKPVSIEDAQMFRLGLRASTTSTLATYTKVREIIGDWRQVMEPEQIVMFGKFIANVGARIAKDHYEKYSRIYHVLASDEMFGDIRDTRVDLMTASDEASVPRAIHIQYIETSSPYTRAHPYSRATFPVEFHLQHKSDRDDTAPPQMRIEIKLPNNEFDSFARKYMEIIAQGSPIEMALDNVMIAMISGEKWFVHLAFIESHSIRRETPE